ncbi:MAG: signal peptidase II [Bifidobacterium sp.]|jgi:signal peptidase II
MRSLHQGRLRARVAVFACIAAVAIGIDQITKACALVALGDGRTIRVIPNLLSLTLVRNPGASLGMGSSVTGLISLLACAACVLLVALAIRTTSMLWTVAFALAFSGAAGNLIDRVAYAQGFMNGKVVDFLDYGWSVGNVADIFLMCAGLGIVLLMLFSQPFEDEAAAPAGHGPGSADGGSVDGAVGAGACDDHPTDDDAARGTRRT